VMRNVGAFMVKEGGNNPQIPQIVIDSLFNKHYLAGQATMEAELWNLCSNSQTVKPCKIYLDRYPQGLYVDLANIRKDDFEARHPEKHQPPVAQTPREGTTPDPQSMMLDHLLIAQTPFESIVTVKEAESWGLCRNSDAIRPCQDYLNDYPQGRYVLLAHIRIDDLKAAVGTNRSYTGNFTSQINHGTGIFVDKNPLNTVNPITTDPAKIIDSINNSGKGQNIGKTDPRTAVETKPFHTVNTITTDSAKIIDSINNSGKGQNIGTTSGTNLFTPPKSTIDINYGTGTSFGKTSSTADLATAVETKHFSTVNTITETDWGAVQRLSTGLTSSHSPTDTFQSRMSGTNPLTSHNSTIEIKNGTGTSIVIPSALSIPGSFTTTPISLPQTIRP